MKYKVIETTPRVYKNPEGKEIPFKECELEGEDGKTVLASVWGNRLAEVFPTATIEGTIDTSGRSPKFQFPKKGFGGGPARDYAGEEERRSKRIAFLACTERAVEVVNYMEDKPKTGQEMQKTIVAWRDWFIKQYEDNTK